jgi:N-acetylneuraminic acid mutarotase
LIAGGQVNTLSGVTVKLVLPATVATAELYDPATNTFSAAASLLGKRDTHNATLLPNGKVLVAGGMVYVSGITVTSPDVLTAELYDPATNSWTSTGGLISAHATKDAILLPDGRVLVAGGYAYSAVNFYLTPSLFAEIYDPATGLWTATGAPTVAMNAVNVNNSASLLPNGKVVFIGGANFDGPSVLASGSFSSNLFDPATGTWSSATNITAANTGVFGQTGTLLSDGRLIVIGGNTGNLFTSSIPVTTGNLFW